MENNKLKKDVKHLEMRKKFNLISWPGVACCLRLTKIDLQVTHALVIITKIVFLCSGLKLGRNS